MRTKKTDKRKKNASNDNIINVCNLFAPIVGPLIGIINILILFCMCVLRVSGADPGFQVRGERT